MRARPIRARIYTPVVRFGIVSTDWKFILAATLGGYLIPFFLNLRLWRVPLFLWTGLFCALVSYAFFFFIRIGRKPYWFQHTIRALIESPIQRRVLPSDYKRSRSWIIDK
ncbi:MAG TPA: hypothetical protein VFC63_22935 [Blastocatellia bacterium]|nr:hypothetical protein [Blastocatellia bacterium]